MPNATVELIKITGVSPYSVYAGQTRYSFNKGVDSSMFAKGNTYSVAVRIGKNGGKYIDRVDNNLGVINVEPAQASVPTTNKNQRPLNPETNMLVSATHPRRSKQGEPLTDYDLEVQERISRSGVIQAAVQAVASHASSPQDLEAKAITLAEAMLKWVNQNNKEVSPLPQPVSEQPSAN